MWNGYVLPLPVVYSFGGWGRAWEGHQLGRQGEDPAWAGSGTTSGLYGCILFSELGHAVWRLSSLP